MSSGPKRPPRPSRPRSSHGDDRDISSSSSAVDGTLATCSDNEHDQCTSSESVNTQTKLSITLPAGIEAMTTAMKEIAVISHCENNISDKLTAETQSCENSTKTEGPESGRIENRVSSPAKSVIPGKPGVAVHSLPADVKFRYSPKARKAPPVPPPPTSKETRRLSADGERTLEMLPDDGENGSESCRNILQDLSPCIRCTSALSSSSVSSRDSKPALKPKPVTTITRESVGSDHVSYTSHVVSGSSVVSDQMSSNSVPSSTISTTASASPPVYAVVNKSRTLRSKSDIDSDRSNVNKPSVARSKSVVASGSTPPRKPPRTFAHSEYMRLKSLSLPRSSELQSASNYEEVTAPPSTILEATDPVNKLTDQDDVDSDVKLEVCESGDPVTQSKDCRSGSVDGSDKDSANKTKDVSGKMKRRQSDKLPAPPRPPPPAFSDNRSSTVSPRSSMVDTAAATANLSDQLHDRDSDCQKQECASLLSEEKLMANNKLASGSDMSDNDDVYAVPSEVNCNVARRTLLAGASTAASEATEPTRCPVGDQIMLYLYLLYLYI